jgi:DNA-binding response OmpR family regulator
MPDARRVLVVDDNAVIGSGLAEYLARRGWDAQWATCGMAAQARWSVWPAGCVVLDWVLPGCLTGADLLRWLLAREPRPRVVVLTGLPGDLEVPPGVPVLRKPCDPEEVAGALEAT